MKNIVATELAPEIFAQGLGLQKDGNSDYVGKIGLHEVILTNSEAVTRLASVDGEVQLVYLGSAHVRSQVRPGDILMAGSDELLDKAFRALDELEQRGVVLPLNSPEEGQIQAGQADPGQEEREILLNRARMWKEYKHPFLCLFLVEGEELQSRAPLVALVRKIINE